MALNPNIILSGMPQPFDMNALLQQQISGMENINALERQRRADELAMQDRATAAEKEAMQAQEAATIKALLPAYTYGIQTGDMAGALNLVPPEMQESLRPYADALVGKSPQEVQAALIGSLSSSPAGQEALGAIQRAQTAQIQLGQLDVSRGRLAFDTEQAAAAAAAAGQPKPMTEYEAERIKLDREKAARDAAAEGEGKGKVDPVAATKADDTLGKIMAAYQKLKDLQAITSTEQTAGQNLAATISAKTGSTVGAAIGSEAQTQRQIIKNLRQALLNDIKVATGMSSKAIDSNVELQSFLNSLGDPESQSYEAAIATIGELSAKYASGALSGVAQDILKGKSDLPSAPAPAPAPGGFRILNVR